LLELEGLRRRLNTPLSCEQELERYERFAVEDHVRDIITELCKLPAARDEFGLGDGIQFSSHTNLLNKTEVSEVVASQPSTIPNPRPDQFCIHRVNSNISTVLTSVEYKPPHKLPVATLRMGLHPMNLWKAMVKSNKIPTRQEAKLEYNAEWLACSAIVQEYHVMIQEGLEYAYVTNGIARVLLHVLQDNPSTLYYFFCDPNSEVNPEANYNSQLSRTSVARTLCLCLLAFRSPTRSRNGVNLHDKAWKFGRLVLTTLTLRFPKQNGSRPFLTLIAQPWSSRAQNQVQHMNRHRLLQIRQQQAAVEWPQDPKQAVHLRGRNAARSLQIRPAPIRTTQRGGSGISAKSHPHPHPLPKQRPVNARPVKIKAVSPDVLMRNFARSDVYLGCRLEVS
jgi:hypothetical protein